MEKTNITIKENWTNQDNSGINYCLYARRSSDENSERQVMSIDSQIKEMQLIAKTQNLNVTEVRTESKSAKESGQREVFKNLLKDIKQGMFQGILTWAPDRLARNAGDLGEVVDLMDQGHLIKIKTYSQTFTNSPNEKFLLMILGSQAKLENDCRGVNVQRGLRAKANMGWRPGLAPLGYLNNGIATAKERIMVDPERGPIITEMFKKVGVFGYTGRMLYKWLNSEKQFTTRNNRKLALSGIYRILATPFYYGKFEYPVKSGIWYNGIHKPLIDKQLFDAVQEQLEVAPKLRWGSKDFEFTRIIKCGKCGSGVTAEDKYKNHKDGTRQRYIYYHCTRSVDLECPEKYIREEVLVEQLIRLIDKIDLKQIETKKKFQKELERFNSFAKGVLKMDSNIEENKFDMKVYGKYVLQNGTKEEKRELLRCIKSQIYLKDQKIYLE